MAFNGQSSITAKGTNGEVSFDGEMVGIKRKGGHPTAGKGERRIFLSAIVAIQWKPAGAIRDGFIVFEIAGGKDRQPRGFGRAKWTAKDDENAITFNGRQEKKMRDIRDAVEKAISLGRD